MNKGYGGAGIALVVLASAPLAMCMVMIESGKKRQDEEARHQFARAVLSYVCIQKPHGLAEGEKIIIANNRPLIDVDTVDETLRQLQKEMRAVGTGRFSQVAKAILTGPSGARTEITGHGTKWDVITEEDEVRTFRLTEAKCPLERTGEIGRVHPTARFGSQTLKLAAG
jgi:hypothetical protein